MSQPIDLIVRGARIVDGSGAPAFTGDVAVSGDRIVAVGALPTDARLAPQAVQIAAAGRVLAPGFIDIHTHYDPQLCWDRLATPSPEHGVTSLVMGNCSIGMAPVRPQHRHKLVHLFGSVEDMAGSLLEATVPFAWESMAEYLAWQRAGLGPNVGVLVGHAVLRLYVMGDAAQQRAATDDEIDRLCVALSEAMAAGALGLSFSFAHLDEAGHELPCHYADRREKLALLRTLAQAGRGVVEVAPQLLDPAAGLRQVDEFGELALETGVMCSLSPLLQSQGRQEMWRLMLERFEHWQSRGAPLFAQTQVRPLDFTVRLSQGSAILAKMPSWRAMFDLPLEQRIARLRDAAQRAQMQAEVDTLPGMARLARTVSVKRAIGAANKAYEGARVVDLAREHGCSFTDMLLDIGLADGLETEFAQEGVAHTDEAIVGQLLDHPAVHVGSADAGAHITQFSGAGDTCLLFERYVRQRGGMTLERAVQRLTSDLARAWGLRDRGQIAVGRYADLVLFDPDTIARGPEVWADDLPDGSGRYVRRAVGIHQVIVNGQVLVDEGRYTAARPGRIL